MSCNYNCRSGNTICRRAIFSDSVTVVTVDGTDTLVIDIPASTYFDGCLYCLYIIQAIPTTATINMPVAISIGGVTTTVYPLTNACCAQITACAIRTRTRYPVRVSTSAIGGTFKVLCGLSCSPNNALASLPIATAAAASVSTMSATTTAPKKVATAPTTTKKTTAKTVDSMTVQADTVTVIKEEK